MRCYCAVCATRAAKGEAPLEGVSILATMHVTADEMPNRRVPPRRLPPAAGITPRSAVRQEIQTFADQVLVPAIATALGTMVREAESMFEARATALAARLNRLQQRTAPKADTAALIRKRNGAVPIVSGPRPPRLTRSHRHQ
jgi:hypothetical protein